MKRLFSIMGLLLAFALPNHAQTKTDTIKFEVTHPEVGFYSLDCKFSEQVRNGIEIEWVSADGTASDKFSPDADGKYTQTIRNNGTSYIYYTHEQGSTYSAFLGLTSSDDEFDEFDIKIVSKKESLLSAITSVDVSGCTALTELSCYKNSLLTSFDVNGCTALTGLDCRYNRLTSLDVSTNTALTWLDCSYNRFTSLDVSKYTALTALDCYYNQLTSLDVSKNTALTGLDCRYNRLTSLDVSKNTALTELDCSWNQLTSLDVGNDTALTDLICNWNRIPLSILYKVYVQSSKWYSFTVEPQSDSILLFVDQPLDLSTERILGQTISDFDVRDLGDPSATGFWTVNKFVFQFHKTFDGYLYLDNSALQSIAWGSPIRIGVTFTWYISVVDQDQIPEGYFTISVASNNSEWGTASPGNAIYKKGEDVTITATPAEGYRFVNWTKGGEVFSTEATYKFIVTEDLELIANFEQNAGNEGRENDNFYVYAQDRNIILSENRGLVQVFNAVGQCVYSGNATIIPVRQSGVYVVRVGANSHKVIVK